MITGSKFLIGLGVALITLGQVARACNQFTSFALNYDFKSAACKRSAVFQATFDCEECAEDLPTIIATFATGNSDCQQLASTLKFNCAADGYNDIKCGTVLTEDRYLNCTEGFFTCCIGEYVEYAEAVLLSDVSSLYNYSSLCANYPEVTIPDYGTCTDIDTTGVTPVDLPELPDDENELTLNCSQVDAILTKRMSKCIPGPDSKDLDSSVFCSQSCASEVADLYDEFVAIGSTGCVYGAIQILNFCQYDTVSKKYCYDVENETLGDYCGYASTCCGASSLASIEKYADTLAEPYKTYLKYVNIFLDPDLVCSEGTTVAAASTCQPAAAAALTGTTGSAATLSIWVAAAVVAIFSIYISM